MNKVHLIEIRSYEDSLHGGFIVDAVVAHVASSLENAELYIKANKLGEEYWWAVYEQDIDKETRGFILLHYDHLGNRITSPPRYKS